ncbi:MAG: hypothetical protein U1F43_38450 [Myxococcota bacterium]
MRPSPSTDGGSASTRMAPALAGTSRWLVIATWRSPPGGTGKTFSVHCPGASSTSSAGSRRVDGGRTMAS